MTDEQLSALLRLKRYEQPAPQYFDRLLQDIHRRQRAELLRRPLWKIAVERMQTFFGEHSMSHASYAGAMAAVMVAGVTVIGLMTPSGGIKDRLEAKVSHPASIAPASPDTRFIALENAPLPKLDSQTAQVPSAGLQPVSREPRY